MIISRLGGGSGSIKVIAQAIGSPATEKDKKQRLAEMIDTAQTDIANLCNERGCNIPANPTFPQIINGISSLTHFTKPAQITGLRSVGSHDVANVIDLYWNNPTNDKNFRGVNIRYKTGGYPTSETDGTSAYDGTGTSVSLSNMTNGTTYYFRAFAYSIVDSVRVFNNLTSGAECTGVSTLNIPSQITSLRSVGNHDTANIIDLSWSKPSDSKYKGVKILYKTGSYPSSPTDGTVAYNGTGTSASLSGMTNGTTYYFRAFSYNLSNGVYAYHTGTSGAQCTGVSTLNTPSQISGLKATVGSLTSGYVKLTWTNPSDSKYKGVRILYKTGGYPTSITDGTVLYTGTGTSVEKTGLTNGTTYYFRAFAYNLSNSIYAYNTSMSGAQCTGTPFINKGQQIFTSSGTFTIPAGVNKIDVFLVGGGGSGNCAAGYASAGGGAGYAETVKGISVTSGSTIAITIGAGGNFVGWIQNSESYGHDGGQTICRVNNVAYVANGGKGGESIAKNKSKGGNGGSAGGGALVAATDDGRFIAMYEGGSDGSDKGAKWCDNTATDIIGKGQGRTTRAFGESTGTLYSGGGGSAGYCYNSRKSMAGGAGGGGAGGSGISGSSASKGGNGTPNTGGGGGAGNTAHTSSEYGASGAGGSGIVIVRWGY